MDMNALSIALERIVRRQVIDKTGLTGAFDMDITYTLETLDAPGGTVGPVDAASQGGPALFTALRNQLGLRLDRPRPGRCARRRHRAAAN